MGVLTHFLWVAALLIVFCNAQTIPEPIMYCDFDDGLCPGWENEDDQTYRWVVRKKPPKEAGPKYDYTVGGPGGGFLYFFDQRPKFGRAIIRTPRMDLTQHEKYCLRFVYFSAGAAPGEIRFYHSNKKEFGRSVSLFFRAGARSLNDTHWLFEDVTVSKFFSEQKFDDVYFRIQASTGRGDTNVFALDDVSVTPGECPKFVLPDTATTATFAPSPATEPGSAGAIGDMTNLEVMRRNEELVRENEERNRKIQEMNDLLNSGQYSPSPDPDQPSQPFQPTQPTQPHEGLSEEEKQQQILEEQRRLQEEAENQRKEEKERVEKEEKERKELIEKRRREQEEKQRQKVEEQGKKNKEAKEKQKQERLRKKKEDEERRKVEMAKKREENERKAKEIAERQRKQREEQGRKDHEELELKRKADEERLRKIEEDRAQTQSQSQDQNQNKNPTKNQQQNRNQNQNNRQGGKRQGGGRGKGKTTPGGKRGGGKGKGNQAKANDPNYEKCGKTYAHKTNQICCNGSPKKNVNQNMMCCGKSGYNPTKRGCCGTKTYDARGTTQCCGKVLYDATTHACCRETAYELATNNCIEGVLQPIVV